METRNRTRKHDKFAMWILVGCLGALISIYVFERLIGIYWHDLDATGSNLFSFVTETLKFLISSLLGFLYAKRTI